MARQTREEREHEVREQYEAVTDKLFIDRQAFKDFLSFSGKHYKLPADHAMMVFYTNPNADMVTDYDTWQKLGRQVTRGQKSIAAFENGKLWHYFDISQTEGKAIKPRWHFDKDMAAAFTAEVSSREGKTFNSITSCVDYFSDSQTYGQIASLNGALNIDAEKRKAFSKSVSTMVRAVVAARCGYNSKFNYKSDPLDLSALDMLHSKAELEKLTDFVQTNAKAVLLSMEKTVNEIQRRNSYEQGHNQGRNSPDMVRGGQQVLSGDNRGERQNIQARQGNVAVSSGTVAGTDAGGRRTDEEADRTLRSSVAEVHGGELPIRDNRAEGQNEMGADTPADRQGSRGNGVEHGAGVRPEQSQTDNISGNRSVGEDEAARGGSQGNDRSGTPAQRINDTAGADEAPAVSVSEFINLACYSLYEDSVVRNAHESSDKQEFVSEVEREANNFYTRLITGEEKAEYSTDDIAPFYNRFQQDKDFRANILTAVTEYLDENLTNLEQTKQKAAEMGIPFSDRSYNSDEDFNPYVYGGDMSVDDSLKVADANNLHSFMQDYSDELIMAVSSYSLEEFRGYFANRTAEALRDYSTGHKNEQWYKGMLNSSPDYLKSVCDLVSDSLYNELREEIQNRNKTYPIIYVNGSFQRDFNVEDVGFEVNKPYSVAEFNAALNRANELWNSDDKYEDKLHSVSVSVFVDKDTEVSYNVEMYAMYHSIGEVIEMKPSTKPTNVISKLMDISRIESESQSATYSTTEKPQPDEDAGEHAQTEIPSDVDKFYVNPEAENVTWIYYNPDSSSGGQFVYTYMSYDDIFNAMEKDDPLEYLTETCEQSLLDRGTEGFDGVVEEFMTDSEDISSRDEDYLDKLYALTEPRFAIYQLKGGEELRDYRFEPADRLKKNGLYVDRENYNRVYRGRLKEGETLEDIYKRFNLNHPQDFQGHSLSVSDIVAVKSNGTIAAYYVDRVGFTRVPDFTLSREERKARRTLTDNLTLLADNQLATDEMDDLGDKLFDYDNAPKYDGRASWTIGAGLHADDFENLATRYNNGEDIRAELAQKIYGNMTHIEFYEFPPADGIGYIDISTEKTDSGMTFRTKGGFEITHSWETLGEALITAARQEFDRHERLDREYFLTEAKQRINDYSQREFGEEADFSDLSHVPLAYTTHEDTEVGISVYANLVDNKIVTMYGDDIAEEQSFAYTDDMLAALGNLEFSDLVVIADETIQKLTTEEAKPQEEAVQLNLFGDTMEVNGATEQKQAATWTPYIIADLKTWADNTSRTEASKLEHFATFEEAKARFDELRSQPYNSEEARREDGTPYARLTLGMETEHGATDIIHVRAGQNYLVEDFTRQPSILSNPNAMELITRVANEIGFDRVFEYKLLDNGKYDNGTDISFSEWDNHYFEMKAPQPPKQQLPTITCEWSESSVFEEGKTYSVLEFDR